MSRFWRHFNSLTQWKGLFFDDVISRKISKKMRSSNDRKLQKSFWTWTTNSEPFLRVLDVFTFIHSKARCVNAIPIIWEYHFYVHSGHTIMNTTRPMCVDKAETVHSYLNGCEGLDPTHTHLPCNLGISDSLAGPPEHCHAHTKLEVLLAEN